MHLNTLNNFTHCNLKEIEVGYNHSKENTGLSWTNESKRLDYK